MKIDGKTLVYPLDLDEDNNEEIWLYSLTAGRFNSTTHDQLALVYTLNQQTPKILSFRFDVGPDTTDKTKKVIRGTTQRGPWKDDSVQLGLAAAPVIRSGKFAGQAFDQVAVLVGNSDQQVGGGFRLGVVQFDADLNPSGSFPYNTGNGGCPLDMVVGNFDHRRANPSAPSSPLYDPNSQIAVASSFCGGQGGGQIAIVDVDFADNNSSALQKLWRCRGR